MWTSYEALCEMGASDIDPTSVFGVRPAEIDLLKERIHQQNTAQETMPLQEKSILTPHHHFTPPPPPGATAIPPGSAMGPPGGRPMDLGTPSSTGSIGPKATLFQTAQKSKKSGETGSAVILPNQLQFDTPNLTPIPMQQDASFIHHHSQYPPSGAVGQDSMMSGVDISAIHGFVDSYNPHTVRRAKHVAARLYYQPSPETPNYDTRHGGIPTSGRYQNSGVPVSAAVRGASPTRRYLRGKSALFSTTTSGIALEVAISDTPLRRGGRPSDISTVRRPRALFLSENKAMRENTNDLNHSSSSAVDDDDENTFRRPRSRSQPDGEDDDLGMDDENHPDDDQHSMMMAEENAGGVAANNNTGAQEDRKPVTVRHYQNDVTAALDEDAIMEKHTMVQKILELFCVLGAGYWRLCQVSLFTCPELNTREYNHSGVSHNVLCAIFCCC
jgi:hypothetical protein